MSAMEIRLDALAASPDIYPQKLDLLRDSALLIRLGEKDYRDASFLDDRILRSDTVGAWAHTSALAERLPAASAAKPIHFIFHAGHVGSTLLSRVLDATGTVLGLREPLPLRTLADAHDTLARPDSLLSAEAFTVRLESFLRLWRRGYATTEAVVVKATSTAARLHGRLLEATPEARAVYLNLAAEPYLATLLAGENAMSDLRAHGPERIRRLQRVLAEATPHLHALSPGELAAASWLAERLCEENAAAAFGSRILRLDFENFLSDAPAAVTGVLNHFSLRAPPHFAESVHTLSAFSRYSKAPEQFAYSPELRRQILAQARANHRAEIAAGLRLLERLAARNSEIAALL